MDIQKTSLKIVGAIWLIVGICLSIAGINWLRELSVGPKMFLFISLATIIGLSKGRFMLTKVAVKYYKKSEVIKFNGNDIYTGWAKIIGVKGAVLVFIMMFLGSFLRHSNIDRPILGVIYLAVGIALLYASKVFFKDKI